MNSVWSLCIFLNLYPSPAIFTLITKKFTVRLRLSDFCLQSFCPETYTGRYLYTGAVEDVTSRFWVHLTLEREGCTFIRNVGTCKPCCTHDKTFQKTRILTIGADETSANSCAVCWTYWALLLIRQAYEVFCRLQISGQREKARCLCLIDLNFTSKQIRPTFM
jgi:hypothetical protein